MFFTDLLLWLYRWSNTSEERRKQECYVKSPFSWCAVEMINFLTSLLYQSPLYWRRTPRFDAPIANRGHDLADPMTNFGANVDILQTEAVIGRYPIKIENFRGGAFHTNWKDSGRKCSGLSSGEKLWNFRTSIPNSVMFLVNSWEESCLWGYTRCLSKRSPAYHIQLLSKLK